MSKREEPGMPAMALQMASIIRRHAKTHGFTRTERLTAYNLLMVECILEYVTSDQGIKEAVDAFEKSLRLGFEDQDTNPGG